MKPGWIAAWAVAALVVPGLAACGGSSPGASSSSGSSPGASSSPSQGATSQSQGTSKSDTSSQTGAQGALTAPGTHLSLDRTATVGWVPPTQYSATRANKALTLRVTVVSIQKGTIADFQNVDLNASQKKDTPYYVTVRVTALGGTVPPANSDPAIAFRAIDDRGQEQESITFLGTFSRCDEATPPKPFVNGKSYQSCLAYLMPGGGAIQKVEWNDGPSKANEVTPYFDNPIIWAG
jgi:hypothetical protein